MTASRAVTQGMWRFRHLIVLLSIGAVAYYFSFMFQADWKVLAVLGTLFAIIYVAASMADPVRPEKPRPEPPPEEPSHHQR